MLSVKKLEMQVTFYCQDYGYVLVNTSCVAVPHVYRLLMPAVWKGIENILWC